MEVSEVKTALLSKRPVMLKVKLLGEVFQSEITAVIYRREGDDIDVSVETRDAFTNAVTIADPSAVRYATAEEIRDFYIKRKNVKHIKPTDFYDSNLKASYYKATKNMSIIEMAGFLLDIKENKKLPFCKVGLCEDISQDGLCNKHNDFCFKAILNWLESEAEA